MGAMNELIDTDVLARLVEQLHIAAPARDFERTSRITSAQLAPLALRARSDLVAAALLVDLPADYERAAAIIRTALADDQFKGWGIWPVTEALTTLSLASPHPDAFEDGLALLVQLTPRLTSEFAIRRFLEANLGRALPVVLSWTSDPDAAVRRLASEGTRPFLPWAVRVRSILAAPDSTAPILNALRDDDSEYVRRSVANHLNDLSRESADLALDLAEAWLREAGPHTGPVVHHGLRTLIKKGHPRALELMGFTASKLTISDPLLGSTRVVAPGTLDFSFTITNDDSAPAHVAIDYVIHYLKSNGGHTDKVFKLTTRTLGPGESARLSKSHPFRAMTTRVHYAGVHALEIQVNGRRSGRTEFWLDL